MSYIRIDSELTTYVLDLTSSGIPETIYWGRALDKRTDLEQLALATSKPAYLASLDHPYRLNLFPENGTGFRGKPGLLGHRNGKNWVTLFSLKQAVKDDQSVKIILKDEVTRLELVLEIVMDPATGVLARRSCLKNTSEIPYELHYCTSGAIDIPGFCEELLTFNGCWTGEFMTERIQFSPGLTLFENRAGRTSHEAFPGIIVGTKGFSQISGTLMGVTLGWSGNHTLFAERIPDGTRQIQMGELIAPGEITLQKEQAYKSPWIYCGYSSQGLNGLSQVFHTFMRRRIIPGRVASKPRPVQFNTWEAVYFDHDMDVLKSLASKAASLGLERFVLDDGWFHKRNDDTEGLGDWWPDEKKYPEGLTPLIDHVKSLGMEFGLWVEPEMVNEKSVLFKDHPDWILHLDGYPSRTGRHQFVLDLCKPEVQDYLFDKLNRLLSENRIDYFKWDMNRNLTTAGHDNTAAFHGQTLAVYRLIKSVLNHHPGLEIESCSSGGARIDYEILKRDHRFWASDSNDPQQRQRIQKGSSLFFPPEITGSHIGPAECHTSGRVTSMNFRAMTSLFYHFGCEMDVLALTPGEEIELKQFVRIHKKLRHLFHHGTYVRLDLDEHFRNGYGCVSEDRSTAVFCVVQMETPGQNENQRIRFCGLSENKRYRVRLLTPLDESIEKMLRNPETWVKGFNLSGSVLMESGISLFLPWPQTGVLVQCVEVY